MKSGIKKIVQYPNPGYRGKDIIIRLKSVIAPEQVHTNNSGSAMIITLLLVTILVALVTDFVYEVYIDSSSLSNWTSAQKAALIAESGQAISAQLLKEIKQYKYTDTRELELPVDRDFGRNNSLSIIIQDENSKFNLNSIIGDNKLTNEKALESLKKLLEYLNINPDLSLAIADWIDTDKEPRLTDSEDMAKNTFLWSVDEIKLIKGIDKNTFDKIKQYVTVYKISDALVEKININTAELPVLISLDPDMTKTLAQNIIDQRENYPFEKPEELPNVPGMEIIGTRLQGYIVVKSSDFRVTTTARVNGITRIIESVMDSSLNVRFWRET